MGSGMADIKLPKLPLIPLFMDASCRDEIASIISARDIKIARMVLEAAAKVLSATYLERQDGVYAEFPSFDGGKDCADAIRNLEVPHD